MPIIPYIRVVFPFMGSLSLDRYSLFVDDFERNANISIAIKSGSTVLHFASTLYLSLLTPFLSSQVSGTLKEIECKMKDDMLHKPESGKDDASLSLDMESTALDDDSPCYVNQIPGAPSCSSQVQPGLIPAPVYQIPGYPIHFSHPPNSPYQCQLHALQCTQPIYSNYPLPGQPFLAADMQSSIAALQPVSEVREPLLSADDGTDYSIHELSASLPTPSIAAPLTAGPSHVAVTGPFSPLDPSYPDSPKSNQANDYVNLPGTGDESLDDCSSAGSGRDINQLLGSDDEDSGDEGIYLGDVQQVLPSDLRSELDRVQI